MKYYVINSANVSSEIFDNEAVVVNFITGKYFGMSGSGPEIWRMFEQPCNLERVRELLATDSSDISDGQAKNLEVFINTLLQEGLLKEFDGDVVNANGSTVRLNGEYADPVLEIYDDLQELIVLDPVHDADPERGWPAQQRMIKP